MLGSSTCRKLRLTEYRTVEEKCLLEHHKGQLAQPVHEAGVSRDCGTACLFCEEHTDKTTLSSTQQQPHEMGHWKPPRKRRALEEEQRVPN